MGGGQPWQPGLYTVLLQGRLTDALGLGDVVRRDDSELEYPANPMRSMLQPYVSRLQPYVI